jgi:hypothetical protein
MIQQLAEYKISSTLPLFWLGKIGVELKTATPHSHNHSFKRKK